LFTRQKINLGQSHAIINIIFEPYLDKNKDCFDYVLKDIQNAFFSKNRQLSVCTELISQAKLTLTTKGII
jgi:hypothetical protein